MPQRILCIDYGEVRCGFAVSDPTGVLAVGLGTLTITGKKMLIEHIKKIIKEYGINIIVLGNPINLNGTRGEKSAFVTSLAERIENETNVKTVLFDERLSTLAAHRIMNETGTHGKRRKETIDTLSAQIILQNYMDSEKNNQTKSENSNLI